MGIDTTYRIDARETMDDFTLEGEELRDALDKIAAINRLLGGNKLTLEGVKSLLSKTQKRTLTIVDVGCGSGDMLHVLADFGAKNNLELTLIGIDANPFTIRHARSISGNYPNITFRCENIFDKSFREINCDIILCTLTLHHFKDKEILGLITTFQRQAKLGIVINDLQRSMVAYRLFQCICAVFGLNKMSREDGLVSILRGFKERELVAFSKQLELKKYSIRWKWAFRYQWIISNI